ncbi:MAG: FAD-dependent oxidoreductase [Epsilonproteobacteria bacterium]|nr:FAD-dependent oxidoreductase [Campylobacterota bacterium]
MGKRGKIGIVGGGVAGVTAALTAAGAGLETVLFERNASLIGGPPFCHLHAGGNLYREISDAQCVTLLRQSIEFARLYPFAVDKRPTVIAVPVDDGGRPEDLLSRLAMLRQHYARLVDEDSANAVLGAPDDYFTLFDEHRLAKAAKGAGNDRLPESPDGWMAPLARRLNKELVRFPLILVQEYGLNLFRLSAGAKLLLGRMSGVDLRLGTRVRRVRRQGKGFLVGTDRDEVYVDYLVNAAGFRTGEIDNMLGLTPRRMVEFKAAYTAWWKNRERYWPEVIFHGRRGTPKGMGQFTPYAGGYVQLHGMTREITLFDDGLVASTAHDAFPKLPDRLRERIIKGWSADEVARRTGRAIAHVARFLPDFNEAKVGGPPLFGAQQIPGDDPTLRVAEVAFDAPRYARCEIVKVSSVTDMARALRERFVQEGWIHEKGDNTKNHDLFEAFKEEEISREAEKIAGERGFPLAMSRRMVADTI